MVGQRSFNTLKGSTHRPFFMAVMDTMHLNHESPRSQKVALGLMVLILLCTAASRILHFDALKMDIDEVWTVWQTLGSPVEILNWTPYDWTPLHYLSLGLWRSLTGIHPYTLHLSSLFCFMVGAAAFFRALRHLGGMWAGIIGAGAYAALGYNLYVSTLVRGYALIAALLPLSLWLTLRYLERPTWQRALRLGLCFGAIFYTHVSGLASIAAVGFLGLMLYPRQVWPWIRPFVIVVVVVAPDLLQKLRLILASSRFQGIAEKELPPFGEAMLRFYADLFGGAPIFWVMLLGLSGVLFSIWWWRNRGAPFFYQRTALGAGAAVWLVGLPIIFYGAYPVIGFFLPRYLEWTLLAPALWIGLGAAAGTVVLPQKTRWITGGGILLSLCGLMFVPTPEYGIPTSDLGRNLALLQKEYRAGDVIVIDPNGLHTTPEEWDYYTQVYFPSGLKIVPQPGSARRVWYVAADGWQTPALRQQVEEGRLASTFFGHWDLLFRLYEAPPDSVGIAFPNGMRFYGAEILNAVLPDYPTFREGQTIKLRLWWGVDSPPPFDYSLSVRLVDEAGSVLWADDSPPIPAEGPTETSRWIPGRFYVETRRVTLPTIMVTGPYRFILTLYQWWDSTPLTPMITYKAGQTLVESALPIMTFWVKAW